MDLIYYCFSFHIFYIDFSLKDVMYQAKTLRIFLSCINNIFHLWLDTSHFNGKRHLHKSVVIKGSLHMCTWGAEYLWALTTLIFTGMICQSEGYEWMDIGQREKQPPYCELGRSHTCRILHYRCWPSSKTVMNCLCSRGRYGPSPFIYMGTTDI